MIKSIAGKLLTALIKLKYWSIPGPQRYFIRIGYISRFYQIKFCWKDRIVKKPYKIIEFNGEFQQELIRIIPHAYWHFVNGTLSETISCKFTNELYYFSPKHIEKFEARSHIDNEEILWPNSAHNVSISKYKWLPPPYKDYYKNELFKFAKPILIVANRFNTEWGNEPISYLDISILDKIFSRLKHDYQIIYNRPPAKLITNDNSEVRELNDLEFIKQKHSEVINVIDLYEKYGQSVDSYNHLQLLVYSNCNNFISVHGGTATLASYFGGTNIIYSVQGHEHALNEFCTFEALSGASIRLATTYEMLFEEIENEYAR